MKYFDIDKYVPDYKPALLPRARASKKDRLMIEKSAWIHTTQGSYKDGKFSTVPGVKPENVLNWRALERRCAQLDALWFEANSRFWSAVRAARAERRLLKNQELIIFTDHDWTIRCTDDGFSHEDPARLAKELVAGQRPSREFSVMRYEDGGREIGRLEFKSMRILRCKGVYERVLERALRDRIQLYLDSIRDLRSERSYFPSQIYVIENEGRARVATSDSLGRLSWISGDVLTTKKI